MATIFQTISVIKHSRNCKKLLYSIDCHEHDIDQDLHLESMNTMTTKPDENPGPHERHLLRKANNLLFGEQQFKLTDELLKKAQQKDRNFILEYQKEFHDVLEKTVALNPNEESDVILKLKERLDKLYEMSAAINNKQDELKPAIKKLLQIIMAAVRKGAGNDAQAQDELNQEDMAREAHFQLLESSLVADLLNPQSPIDSKELAPTLLSIDKNDLLLAVQIFDGTQLLLLADDAEKLIEELNLPKENKLRAEENLVIIKNHIAYLNQHQNE